MIATLLAALFVIACGSQEDDLLAHEVKHCYRGHYHSQASVPEDKRVHCDREWVTITWVTDPDKVRDRLSRHLHETGEKLTALADGVCSKHCTVYVATDETG